MNDTRATSPIDRIEHFVCGDRHLQRVTEAYDADVIEELTP